MPRESTGYLFRRHGNHHYNIDDRRHLDKPIWFCVQIHGKRRAFSMLTTSRKEVDKSLRDADGTIRITAYLKHLRALIQQGRKAERQYQAVLKKSARR